MLQSCVDVVVFVVVFVVVIVVVAVVVFLVVIVVVFLLVSEIMRQPQSKRSASGRSCGGEAENVIF